MTDLFRPRFILFLMLLCTVWADAPLSTTHAAMGGQNKPQQGAETTSNTHPPPSRQKSSKTGLLLPRIVAISLEPANVRRGPGVEYPLLWQYQRRGVPLEIIDEYGDWRKIRDYDASEGWMHKRLLRGPRMVRLRGDEGSLALRSAADPDAGVMARLQAGTFAQLQECTPAWCALEIGAHQGWVKRGDLWGVYDSEFLADQ
jgi:SH3-like domain-containing protein